MTIYNPFLTDYADRHYVLFDNNEQKTILALEQIDKIAQSFVNGMRTMRGKIRVWTFTKFNARNAKFAGQAFLNKYRLKNWLKKEYSREFVACGRTVNKVHNYNQPHNNQPNLIDI